MNARHRFFALATLATGLAAVSSQGAVSSDGGVAAARRPGLFNHAAVTAALKTVVAQDNAGFHLNMWATIVDRDGVVQVVAMSGADRGDQWPGSRVISAQKANTANSFSLPGLALSTANLYSAVQPGGSLFGLQHSNPVNTDAAYAEPSANYGTSRDPLTGKKIGGVNVFGGGLALYNSAGKLVGGLGISGDTSATDHIVAWRLRHALELDYVPGGVSATGDDNIVHDITTDGNGHEKSAGGWGHPAIDQHERDIAAALPTTSPIRQPAGAK